MTWRKRHAQDQAAIQAAEAAVAEAKRARARVTSLAADVQPGLAELEAHRRDNHILDAMMATLGRGMV